MTGAPLTAADWLGILLQFMALSLVSVSGAIGTVPDMHRFLVEKHGYLADPQFAASIAIAQAAPGPNVLFVALLGWNLGVASAGGLAAGWHAWALGAFGVAVTMTGILLPSCVLTYSVAQWLQRNRLRRAVRAFRQGMGPVVIGLLLATGWVLVSGSSGHAAPWQTWVTAFVTTLIVWRTRIHLLWLLGAGALLGALGII